MGDGGAALTDQQLTSLEEEKRRLAAEQSLLQLDIAAMEAELKRRAGEPADVDTRPHERLAALNAQLSGLAFDDVSVRLVSAEHGVTVTAWTVRAVSAAADAALRLSYVCTRRRRGDATCGDATVLAHSACLAPLVAAAGASLHRLLFGLCELGRLCAERSVAAGCVDGDGAEREARLPRAGGGSVRWSVRFSESLQRFQHVFDVVSDAGVRSRLPPALQREACEKGVQWLLGQLGVRQ